MFSVGYFKEKNGNTEVTKVLLTFYKDYKREFLLGEILVDFVEFKYEVALEAINDVIDSILKSIDPALTIEKWNEYLGIEMFDLEKIINFNVNFKFPEGETEKYFNEYIVAIRNMIEIFIKHNPLYLEYMICLDEFFKIGEEKDAFSLLDFLTKLKDFISNDKNVALKYRTAVDYCLNDNTSYYLKDFAPKIRFLIYSNSDYITDKVELKNLEHQDSIRHIEKKKSKLTGDKWKDFNYAFIEIYTADIETSIYLEFRNLLNNGITLKKCSNCGRYFVGTGRQKNLSLCSRNITGSDKTCEDVGSLNKLKRKKKENPIWSLWYKAQDKNTKRKQNGSLTLNEYDDWVVNGAKLRDRTEIGEITFNEFEKIMNYKPDEIRKWLKKIKYERDDE